VIVTSFGSRAGKLPRMLETRSGVTYLPTARPTRSLVLVAGSGRSGTSLLSGILQRLGYTVPAPEVPADETNPRGFGESQWVVDFHTRLLARAGVQVADARPDAWALTATVGLDRDVTAELRAWLRVQLARADHLVIKDPRISWFLPLWRRCAEELAAAPRFVTMLRHPAAVIDSKQRWYAGRQSHTSRTAGWLNQTLFTERATREASRVFIRYDDLLDDWPQAIGRAADALDLELVRRAQTPALRSVHEFVDRGLQRSQGDWEGLTVPDALRGQADRLWELACRLAAGEDELSEPLDELRGEYVTLYAEAEAIAHSSIAAVRPGTRPAPGSLPPAAVRLIRRVPVRYRRAVPAPVRARLLRLLRRPA
jgi:hypothetical protein